MTFKQMQDDCFRRLGYGISPPVDVVSRLKGMLNETQQELASHPGLQSLLRAVTATVATVSGTATYSVPAGALPFRIHAIRDTSADWKLVQMSTDWYRTIAPDPSATSGISDRWVQLTRGLIALYPTPSDVRTLALDTEAAPADLSADDDEPDWLPSLFHRLLPIGARMKEYEKTDDSRLQTAAAQWAAGVGQLLAHVNNPPDYVLVPGTSARDSVGSSNLGAWFPSGRW